MPGSGPDDLHEEPDIPNNPPTDPPTSQGIDEVFSLFKTYLENRLEQKGKELEEKQKIDLQAEKFKFKSNQKQFVFNAELEELVGKIKEANAQKDHKKVVHLTDQAKALLHKKRSLSNSQTRVKPAGTQFKNTNPKILPRTMRTTRKFAMLEPQLIGKGNRKKENDSSRAIRSVVQLPTWARRIIIFFVVFVSLLFLLYILPVIHSGALLFSRVIYIGSP